MHNKYFKLIFNFVCICIFSYNRRRLDELPFHAYYRGIDLYSSIYLTDISWIYDKICGSSCYQILEDINLQGVPKNEFINVLKDFIEINASILNYDGRQFYSCLYKYLKEKIDKNELKLENNDTKLAQIYSATTVPPVLSFFPQNPALREPTKKCIFDLVVRLPNSDQFVATVSTKNEELGVWDILK